MDVKPEPEGQKMVLCQTGSDQTRAEGQCLFSPLVNNTWDFIMAATVNARKDIKVGEIRKKSVSGNFSINSEYFCRAVHSNSDKYSNLSSNSVLYIWPFHPCILDIDINYYILVQICYDPNSNNPILTSLSI